MKISKTYNQYVTKINELLTTKVPAYNKGTYFLELNCGISNDIGLYNLRDFLNHVILILSHPSESEKFYIEQLSQAEEHLRRGMVEPFELAANIVLDELRKNWEIYSRDIVPLLSTADAYRFQPIKEKSASKQFSDIKKLLQSGREGKSINRWTPDWEASLQKFIDAYDIATNFNNTLKHNISIYYGLKEKRKETKYKRLAMFFAITSVILGCISIILVILR